MHHPVYSKQGYKEVINIVAEDSMRAAVEEAKAQPSYDSAGSSALVLCTTYLPQWVITDAHHDSTTNAFHTTVPCLAGRYIQCVPVHVSYVRSRASLV